MYPEPYFAETTEEFVEMLNLKPGNVVLDVGCGIGGGDFYMAEKYDVEVIGIDLSVNMISIALERAIGLNCACQFEVADCTTKEYPDETFDVVYSRDTILHIQVNRASSLIRLNASVRILHGLEVFSQTKCLYFVPLTLATMFWTCRDVKR